jgi:ATP-dependent Lon protease
MGGICPIECNWFPSKTFLDLKLTGMQGDVMQESMNVAKTLAWKLTPAAKQKKLIAKFEKEHLWAGIHIHCPEGATPKDGPSAGTAITIAIFSLLNSIKIKNNIAITGEINLQGNTTAIGGLDLKILGGIKAGVKEFIYPRENKYDFKKFIDKYKENTCITGIIFHEVKSIQDVLDLVFV